MRPDLGFSLTALACLEVEPGRLPELGREFVPARPMTFSQLVLLRLLLEVPPLPFLTQLLLLLFVVKDFELSRPRKDFVSVPESGDVVVMSVKEEDDVDRPRPPAVVVRAVG
jgi:hypothetical protein